MIASTQPAEPTKIVELRIENIKRITAAEVHPRGHMVEISGKNRQGKSSLLDAIALALAGKKWACDEPIRQGADRGKVTLTLDNGMVVTRTFTEAGGTLTVTAGDGKKYSSPQALLDSLVGSLSFDPLEFCNLKPADQRKALIELVGVDTSELDEERVRTFDERTEVNRGLKSLKAMVDALPFNQGVPETEQSAAEIVEQIGRAVASAAASSKATQNADAAEQEFQRAKAEVARLETLLATAREALKQADIAADNAILAAREANESVIPVAPLQEQLATIEATNAKVRANNSRSIGLKNLSDAESKSAALTKRLEAIDAEKSELLASAKFPVPGLSFDDSGVLLNGVPFSQASSREQIVVSMSMGLALSPHLKIALIRNGSLCDEDGLEAIAEAAEMAEAQVWVERVDSSGTVGIVIEDGTVKTVNAEVARV